MQNEKTRAPMSGFFNDSPAFGTNTTPCVGWANRLATLMLKLRRTREVSMRVWQADFRRLRRHRADAEIEAALTWLEDHAADKFAPRVYSASTFRIKFDRIVEVMVDPLTGVEVTDQARLVAQHLGGLIWPGDEKKDELLAIQVSLDNYQAFMAVLRRHRENSSLARWLCGVMPPASEFVEQWFSVTHRMVHSSGRWSGKLGRCVVQVESLRFRRIVNGWCCEYKGQGEWWPLVEEMLCEAG